MVASLIRACAGACLTIASSGEAPVEPPDRIFLSCRGTLVAADAGKSDPIITNAIVDLGRHAVYGFGMGAIPIAYVTVGEVSFASPTVDGSLDRKTGHTVVTLHGPTRQSPALMSFDLACGQSDRPS
ncbi:MAG: hypothetical protein J0H94_10475 [Rhizobiales bacterium]|nr:hypothetical protein [Hyphomicrobiales bacterium]